MPIQSELIDDLAALEPYREPWDRLAVELSQPYCAPGWALSWWRHAAPSSAELRVVVAREGDELVGIAPLYVDRWGGRLRRYSFLAAEACWRVEPLAHPELRNEVAASFAGALNDARPRPDLVSFRYVPADSPWPELMARSWPSRHRPRIHHDSWLPSPTVALRAEGLDDWLKTRSRNLRSQIRRQRKKIEKEGGVFSSSADPAEIEGDLETFFRLHFGRWEKRGGSWAAGRGLEPALKSAAAELAPDARLRLASVRVAGEPVGMAIVLAAGEEAGYWLGGFDQDWSHGSPGLLAVVEAVDDGLRRSETRLDLGPGGEDYKFRLADDQDQLHVMSVMPVTRRYPMVRLQLMARSVLHWVRKRARPRSEGDIRQ
jgi:CelD/BcsL family acetyltransferase involved in cellulose biosynthesis